MAVASDGKENQIGFEGPGAMRGFELFERKIDAPERAKIAANTALTMLHAPNCPAGVMPVVMAGGFGGVVSFELKCGKERTAEFVNNLQLCTLAVSLGDAITLIEHPASMTHSAHDMATVAAIAPTRFFKFVAIMAFPF